MPHLATVLLMLLSVSCGPAAGLGNTSYMEATCSPGCFPITTGKETALIYVDSLESPAVLRAVGDLQADVHRTTSQTPTIVNNGTAVTAAAIIVGTLGYSTLLATLVNRGILDPTPLTGGWESFIIQTVAHPLPGIASALIIAGSDRRGTIFGIYDLTEQIGVSPWYWWSDVAVTQKVSLFVKPGTHVQQGPPAVKYRGIFLNDERPDLTTWAAEKFGTVVPRKADPPIPDGVPNLNHVFYSRVFELLLRLKANYLWPAMWNNCFNEDDQQNPSLANRYGVVMGTSHQEPMLRAKREWDRRYLETLGRWNYTTEPAVVQAFWREGIARNKAYESIVTIGMRGEGDQPLMPGPPDKVIKVLADIVAVQRKMIAEEYGSNASEVPQLWCLYKEVVGYYQAGLRVPDDVTLLWTDDNYGNIRRLPTTEERRRSGGAGVYYHLDYYGHPRSYQWVNTNPLPKIWDQMSLAKGYGADRIWIANAGHLKGYEFPIEYFLSLGWDNVSRWNNTNTAEYTMLWAVREFGPTHASDIADIVSKYSKYNGRRKPELLNASTYSVVAYQEFDTVAAEFKAIAGRANVIRRLLPPEKQAAFFQLVVFPTNASWQVNEMYLAAAKNALYARQRRAATNDMANRTREMFLADASLTAAWNTLGAGRWNHFMDEPHIGYTGFSGPPNNTLNATTLVNIPVPVAASMGIAIQGSERAWPGATVPAIVPRFDALTQQRCFIDVFNRGQTPFDFTATATDRWVVVNSSSSSVEKQLRVWISIRWEQAPPDTASTSITFVGAGVNVTVEVNTLNPSGVSRASLLSGFAEGAGYVSIDAEHYTALTNVGQKRWIKIDDFGHSLSAMRAAAAADAPSATPGRNAACLEYRMYLFTAGAAVVNLILSATLNFVPGRGLRYAVAFDDESPKVVTLVPQNYTAQFGNPDWEASVKIDGRHSYTDHVLPVPGYHTLKVWAVDPGVVVQRLVVDLGGVEPSYLGPPESYYTAAAAA